jgi:multiple sugar transport system substrate-binding protein
MQFLKNKLSLLLIILTALPLMGLGCKGTDPEVAQKSEPITLKYWRVWDGPDAFDEIIDKYKKLHPHVKIEYRKLRYEEYEKELLEALAEDRGPDIFSIHNTWVAKYRNKIEPMPEQTSMVVPVLQGSIKQEVVNQLQTNKSFTLKQIKNDFVDAVYDDVVLSVEESVDSANGGKKTIEVEKIFALPLSVDTLALYYNKDLFNNAGIANPPQYWNREFQLAVKALSKQDSAGNIFQSGIALGGSKNIERYSDILSVLMMQNGAQMMNDDGQVLFQTVPLSLKGQGYNPGLEALRFYIDFSDPAKEVYSWNSKLGNSIDLFVEGKLAMMLGYAYHLPTIKSRAPKLNFAIAPLPRIEGSSATANYANYWVETVSKKSKNTEAAWDFLQFAAKAENVKSYLAVAKKPTALRSLVAEQLNDPDLDVFAGQVLTAKNWYHGMDSNAMEEMMAQMIDAAILGEDKLMDVLNLGAQRVQQTVR